MLAPAHPSQDEQGSLPGDAAGSGICFATLGSGSKGNGTLVRAGGTVILIDCGFGPQDLQRRLAGLGMVPADLSAILVTHEHGDHARGVMSLTRLARIPVYASAGTVMGIKRLKKYVGLNVVADGQRHAVGELEIEAVTVPHDAREPTQFVIRGGGCKLGLLTDLGHASSRVVDAYGDCDALLVEFNHCPEMLARSEYPDVLKARIAGPLGHLSNPAAADLLERVAGPRLAHLVAMHLSERNNLPAEVRQLIEATLPGHSASVRIAAQDEPIDWTEVPVASFAGA